MYLFDLRFRVRRERKLLLETVPCTQEGEVIAGNRSVSYCCMETIPCTQEEEVIAGNRFSGVQTRVCLIFISPF